MFRVPTQENGDNDDDHDDHRSHHDELASMEIIQNGNSTRLITNDNDHNNKTDNDLGGSEEFHDEPDDDDPAHTTYASLNTQQSIDDDDNQLLTNDNTADDSNNSRISIDDAIELLGMGPFQQKIFVAAGTCFMADSMEVLLLSFLSVIFRAQWGWSNDEAASVTSAVFVGQSVGTLCLGYMGDRMGRKPAFLVTAGIICLFGLATSFCNTLFGLVLCRFMVGFGVGGLTVPFDTFAEFIPNSHRGRDLIKIEYWWCLGMLLVSLLAMVTLGQSSDGDSGRNDNSWRWFVVWCSVPCFISSVVSWFYVPESPRWLVSQGRQGEALTVLKGAAMVNGKDPTQLFPPGTEVYQLEAQHAERFLDLFQPQWIRTTLLLTLVWAGYTIIAYSNLFMVTLIFSNESDGSSQTDNNGANSTEGGYSFDYKAILASTPSEIVGTTLVLLTIDQVGRIPSQVVTYAIGGIAAFAMCSLASSSDNNTNEESQQSSARWMLIGVGFVARMCFFAGSCVTWVTTTEVLPTEIRNVGHSAANAVGRLSAALSPFLASNDRPFVTTGTIILVISIVTAVASSGLTETKGAIMGLVPSSSSSSSSGSGAAARGGAPGRPGYSVV